MAVNNKIPLTDSVQELAYFWDNHDLTDYEDELEEIQEPVFERKTVLKINLRYDEINKVKKIASSAGISYDELIRNWIIERIHAVV